VTVRKLRKQDDALLVQQDEQELVKALLTQRGRTELGLFDKDVSRKFESKIASAV
jgi:hypothetical protein